MIIQRVIKGMRQVPKSTVQAMLDAGIQCNLCLKRGPIAYADIPKMLTERNLEWHQDHFEDPDPSWASPKNEDFQHHTPFISTSAGTVERRKGQNVRRKAFEIALKFATDGLTVDGWLFYCDLFVLGRPAVELPAFSEELRELNVQTRYSVHQTEGEIVAKILIPPSQIEQADFFDVGDVKDALANGRIPCPNDTLSNALYVNSSRYNNVRGFID